MAGKRLTSGATIYEVRTDLAELVRFSAEGVPLEQLQTLIKEKLEPHLMDYGSRTFQSMFNAPLSAESRLGADLMLDYNQGVTNWQVSPGGAMLEEMCGRALCRLFGLAESADATFMYSGTYGNQQAVYMALHRYAERNGFDFGETGLAGFADPGRLAVMVSVDAHFSLRHAARMLGLGEQAIIKMPLDKNRRVDAEATKKIVAEIASERNIFCIVATAGTTSTGSVDPIEPLAELAAEYGAWLHVDGAYGYAYKLVPESAHLFAGDHWADSISWDPHKQLQAPIPNSMLFVKDGQDFGRMSLYSGYFNREDDPEPNPGLKSPPTTRPMSALPLVTILKGKGLDQLVAELRGPLLAMRQLAAYLSEHRGYELCHEPDTGILCFRVASSMREGNEHGLTHREIYQQIMSAGDRSISTTTLDGEVVLRLVSVEPEKTGRDLIGTINVIDKLIADNGYRLSDA